MTINVTIPSPIKIKYVPDYTEELEINVGLDETIATFLSGL